MGFRELKKEDQNRERQKAEIDFLRSFNPRKFTALESREREENCNECVVWWVV